MDPLDDVHHHEQQPTRIGPLGLLWRVVASVLLVPVLALAGLNAALLMIAEFFAPTIWVRWPFGSGSLLDEMAGGTHGSFVRYVGFAISAGIASACWAGLTRMWRREG